MDARRDRPKGDAVPLSASLSAFVDLFEFFTDTIRDIKQRKMAPISGPWREYFGEDAPPFEKVLDETTLAALEFQLRLLILLTETKLEELTPSGDDPFALSDEATRYRKRAESKLMDLYYRIHSVRERLGHELIEDPEPSPRIQSESGMKLDLVLEREDEEQGELDDSEPDNNQEGDEAILEVRSPGDADENVFGDEQSALTDIDEDNNESADSSEEELFTADEEPETVDESTESEDAEESTSEETRRVRPFTVVAGTESESAKDDAANADDMEDGSEEAQESIETRMADITEFIGPKLVSTEQMVGAGRYDDFDLPDKEEQKEKEHEADSQPFASHSDDEEHVEPEELRSLEVPPSPVNTSGYDDDDSIPLFDESSSDRDSVDALQQRVSRLKKVHRDTSDLKVKTAGGAWTLSLPYFAGTDSAGEPAALLDLENFIGIHNLAFRGVLDAATKNESSDSDPRITKLVQKLHVYFRRLYANVSHVIGQYGTRILPDTGDSLEPDVFLLLESDLVLFAWKSAEEVRQFRDIFQKMIAKPFNEFMTNSQNKILYMESIIEMLEHSDNRNSAKG